MRRGARRPAVPASAWIAVLVAAALSLTGLACNGSADTPPLEEVDATILPLTLTVAHTTAVARQITRTAAALETPLPLTLTVSQATVITRQRTRTAGAVVTPAPGTTRPPDE